ncbi:MAG: SEC-C domain-containing protein [Clostridia bacterium]|nr:SEC-C domain-containing protein [Clostridia bacterium]
MNDKINIINININNIDVSSTCGSGLKYKKCHGKEA